MTQETLDIGGTKVPCQKVTWQPRILQSGGPSLAPTRWWIDSSGRVIRRQFELDGMGLVTLDLSTREGVADTAKAGPMRDLGDSSMISLDRPIPNSRLARTVVFRLRWKEATGEPLELASDERQQTQPTADGAIEVLARKGQKPRRVVGAPDAGREFLGTSKFIDTDHPKIRELAQRAGGYEDDCWTAALRLERYVSRNLKPDAAAALVPASEFASTWRGDCRHAALTLAALCRASNMPARTAVGLLYVDKGGRPALGFHMWTEVFIDGQWVGLDGTLGQGGIGAGHVKVSDHSWDKAESLAPLLPVQRLVGRLKGEVVRVDLGD
jgi:transglutaminase-like putative cysteine protease